MGVIVASSLARASSARAQQALRAQHANEVKALEARVNSVAAVAQVVVDSRGQEITELKAALDAERRARVREKEQPAGWAVPEEPSA